MSELKANGCIYCGKVSAYVNKAKRSLSSSLINYRVQCSQCGAVGAMSGTEEGAIALWNDPPYKHILDIELGAYYVVRNGADWTIVKGEEIERTASEDIAGPFAGPLSATAFIKEYASTPGVDLCKVYHKYHMFGLRYMASPSTIMKSMITSMRRKAKATEEAASAPAHEPVDNYSMYHKHMMFPLRYLCGSEAIREAMLSEANIAKASADSEEIKEFFLSEHGK